MGNKRAELFKKMTSLSYEDLKTTIDPQDIFQMIESFIKDQI